MIFRVGLLFMAWALVSCGSKRKAEDVKPVTSMNEPPADHTLVKSMGESKSMAEGNQAAQVQASEAALQKVSPAANGWGYEGDKGPEKWADIKPEYAMCQSGKMQSPVNLKWAKPHVGGDISFHYKPEALKVLDNGYTIEVGMSGSSSVHMRGKTFNLTHIQFRSSSEHALSGNLLPLEAQFFHKSSDGQVLAVGVILIQGHENQTFQDILNSVPKQRNVASEQPDLQFDASKLLPSKNTHYDYMGSLTTPPCNEGVHWLVLNTPVEVSKAQILQFRGFYSKNNRPLQPLNGRKVMNF
jgi:carbonic anhydrase